MGFVLARLCMGALGSALAWVGDVVLTLSDRVPGETYDDSLVSWRRPRFPA